MNAFCLSKNLALMAARGRKTKADFECIVYEPLEGGLGIISERQVGIVDKDGDYTRVPIYKSD